MAVGETGEFPCFFLCLEAVESAADLIFVQGFIDWQATDVLGDVLALVDELGVGLNQANELLTVHSEQIFLPV